MRHYDLMKGICNNKAYLHTLPDSYKIKLSSNGMDSFNRFKQEYFGKKTKTEII